MIIIKSYVILFIIDIHAFTVLILAASDLIQALNLVVATFGFYSHLIEATGGEY